MPSFREERNTELVWQLTSHWQPKRLRIPQDGRKGSRPSGKKVEKRRGEYGSKSQRLGNMHRRVGKKVAREDLKGEGGRKTKKVHGAVGFYEKTDDLQCAGRTRPKA